MRSTCAPHSKCKLGHDSAFPSTDCIYRDILKRVVFREEGENGILSQNAVQVWNHAVVHNQLLRRAKTSNGTLKINNRDVQQVLIPVAPKPKQAELVRLLEAAQKQIDSLVQVETSHSKLKTVLMQDLLTGRKRLQ